MEPPNYAVHDVDEKRGGVITLCSPRCLNTYGNVTLYRGGVPGFFVPFYFTVLHSRIIAVLKIMACLLLIIAKTRTAFKPLFYGLLQMQGRDGVRISLPCLDHAQQDVGHGCGKCLLE